MDLKITNKSAFKIEILGIIIYTIFIIVAILTYAGGTQDNPSNPGYSFWFNTFSDTGRTVAHNGKSNIIAMIFFSIAYSAIAITMIPFYLIFSEFFDEKTLKKKLTKIGAYLGILSSLALLGIVFTPADILYAPHMVFVVIGYFSMLIALILYTTAIFSDERFSKTYKYLFILFSIIFLMFIIVGLSGLIMGIRSFLTIGQKIGRIDFTLFFLILTYKLWKLEEE